jgi:hypothetical protein
MADPLTAIVVLSLSMFYCPDGSPDADNKCRDGSARREWRAEVGVADAIGALKFEQRGGIVRQVPSDDFHVTKRDILRITEDGKPIFTIHQDGTTEQIAGFNADANAVKFWTALRDHLPAMCDTLRLQNDQR